MNRNRILSRPLEPAWMAAALDIAADGTVGDEGRARLEIRLRDEALADEARRKVVEVLHPVWINPPAATAPFIEWAAKRSDDAPDLRPVHLLALMATYPFFGDVAAIVGRLLRNEGVVETKQVRERLKARWGDRESISVATKKCIYTLRSFDALRGTRGSAISKAGLRFDLSGDWTMWAVCALLLTRDNEMTDAATVESAPEFFFLDLRVPLDAAYPLLERMTSGDRRIVYSLRIGESGFARQSEAARAGER